MTENELATVVLDLAFEIHRRLGPGLLESVYHEIMVYELPKRGLNLKSREPIPIIWDDIRLPKAFEADIILGDTILVEFKSIQQISRADKKQTLTYLRLTGLRLGLLLNFGSELMKDGVFRIVNGLSE